jgi:hypothetical protein
VQNTEDVKIAVGKNFDEMVLDEAKDTLLEVKRTTGSHFLAIFFLDVPTFPVSLRNTEYSTDLGSCMLPGATIAKIWNPYTKDLQSGSRASPLFL